MKEKMRAYYRPSKDELTELWDKCVFVLDTNVLLGLYRYPKEARDDLMKVIRQVSSRLWIPHQVALEYQEGRLDVIADQLGKFKEVEDILSSVQDDLTTRLEKLQLDKRHSAITPANFLEQTAQCFDDFRKVLKTLRKKQPDVCDEDSIRDSIDAILEGKIGEPLPDDGLKDLCSDGETRYEQKRPPGYKDRPKGDSVYFLGELAIRRMYGDLIVWQQIINEAQAQQLQYIVFVTDDDKEDWWWKHSGKTIGPRPELIEELSKKAGVSTFYMYNVARFLEYANKYLQTKVKPKSIQQVKEISQLRREPRKEDIGVALGHEGCERAVLEWLKRRYPRDQIVLNTGFPDFTVMRRSGRRTGYEVKDVRERRILPPIRRIIASRMQGNPAEIGLDSLVFILVVENERRTLGMRRWLESIRQDIPEHVIVRIGRIGLDGGNGNTPVFVPLART